MDIQLLIKFKNQLTRLRSFLEERIKKLQKVPEFGNDIDSGDEETDETEEFGTQMAISQDYKEKLADVDTALDKMKKHKYGVCERCGRKISADVLEAAPESRFCKACKKLMQ
ncbi:MAG: TraR/DksA C4-type zinc finger protein [Candidatus Paceibacterota bacterium]